MLPIHRLISVSRSTCISHVLGLPGTIMRSVLRICGAAVDIRIVAVDVAHQGSAATCEATGYRQQRGRRGEQAVAVRPRRAFKSFRSAKKTPWSPETRSIWARSAKTNVCLKKPKLTRQQSNRKQCDIVKNYLAPFATPSRCRTSVCLRASSRLASCRGPGKEGVAAALKSPWGAAKACAFQAFVSRLAGGVSFEG